MGDYSLAFTGSQVDARLERPVGVTGGGTGQTTRYTNVTAALDTSVATGHNITVRHFPYLNMCFVRGTVVLDHVAVSAGAWVPVATIPDGYLPLYRTSLSAAMGTGSRPVSARINNDGVIEICLADDISSSYSYYAYFSGWWLVST